MRGLPGDAVDASGSTTVVDASLLARPATSRALRSCFFIVCFSGLGIQSAWRYGNAREPRVEIQEAGSPGAEGGDPGTPALWRAREPGGLAGGASVGLLDNSRDAVPLDGSPPAASPPVSGSSASSVSSGFGELPLDGSPTGSPPVSGSSVAAGAREDMTRESANTGSIQPEAAQPSSTASALGIVADSEQRQPPEASEGHCVVPTGMRVATVRTASTTFKMVVLGDNDIVSKALYHHGMWEFNSVEGLLRKAGKPLRPAFEQRYFGGGGDGSSSRRKVFLDAGANLGIYSFIFASEGWHVIAVEPMTRNRQAFEATLCLNPAFAKLVTLSSAALISPKEKAENVSCVVRSTNDKINVGNGSIFCKSLALDVLGPHGIAGGESMSREKFCASEHRALEPNLCCKPGSGANCEPVATATLDDILPGLLIENAAQSGLPKDSASPKVDAMKLDVETHECRALEGGEKTLFGSVGALPDFIQVEVAFGDANVCVAAYAQKHGYRVSSDGVDARLVQGRDGSRLNTRRILTFLQDGASVGRMQDAASVGSEFFA